jgi:D-alanine-D-alanine ligase
MIKSNKHIEIVRPSIKGLGSMSKVSSDAAHTTLAKYYTDVGVTIVNNVADLETLATIHPDLVFLGMESAPSNPLLGLADPNMIWLSDFLDSQEIAYTGSGHAAHELGRNKPLAKQRVLNAGLRTAAFCVIEQSHLLKEGDIPLEFPLFIKPTNRGGGLGIDSDSVVYDFEQVRAKIHSLATQLGSDALIEEYLPGREFSVAILKEEHSTAFSVMPIELIAPPDKNGARLLSGRIKSSNAERAVEVIDEVVKSKVTALALDVFHALGARDYGRIDIRLDAAGTPHFLEANLIPSLISGYGSFPKACVLNIGLEYEPMIMRIADLGLARCVDYSEDTLEPVTTITGDSILPPVVTLHTA